MISLFVEKVDACKTLTNQELEVLVKRLLDTTDPTTEDAIAARIRVLLSIHATLLPLQRSIAQLPAPHADKIANELKGVLNTFREMYTKTGEMIYHLKTLNA